MLSKLAHAGRVSRGDSALKGDCARRCRTRHASARHCAPQTTMARPGPVPAKLPRRLAWFVPAMVDHVMTAKLRLRVDHTVQKPDGTLKLVESMFSAIADLT